MATLTSLPSLHPRCPPASPICRPLPSSHTTTSANISLSSSTKDPWLCLHKFRGWTTTTSATTTNTSMRTITVRTT
eukprot:1157282-Pelagomonas_calceolata.AAC.2